MDGEREDAEIDFEFLSAKVEGEPIASLVPGLLMSELENSDDDTQARQLAAERCLDALRLMKLDRPISDLTSEIAAAERSGELERRDQLATEHLELARRRSALLPKAEAMQIGN